MAKIAVQQEERLRRARAVLTQVEVRQDVAGVAANISDSSGLGRGVYHTDGTIEGVVRALAKLMKPEQFVAVVGVQDIAWEGAEALGVDLSRIVLIRSVGEWGLKVIGSLVEGFSFVAVGDVEVAPRHQRALAARARAVEATILTMHPWLTVSAPLTDFDSGESVEETRGGSVLSTPPSPLRKRKEAS